MTDSFVPNPIELAWAAGFFDGEGYCGLRVQGKYTYMLINISQNDTDVLERFKAAVGYGKINGPYQYKDKSLPMYYYKVTKQADVVLVMNQLYPYLSKMKRNQYEKCRLNSSQGCKEYNMLSEEDVTEIRNLYAAGGISMRVLGTIYNCSTGSVSDIVNYRSWKNV